jgi:nucleoporin NUP82
MNDEDVWTQTLQHHPIFTRHKTFEELSGNPDWSLELSTKSLPVFTTTDVLEDRPTPSGRRKTMALKDADLVVAVGKEIRMTTLGVPKFGHRTVNSYKVGAMSPRPESN